MAHDVVVVGASGAGLLAAYELARQGKSVCVYERAEQLAPAPRTLIVTASMNHVLGFVPQPAIVHEVYSFDLRSNGTIAYVALKEPDLIVERSALVRLLAARAQAAGVQLRLGWDFDRFELEGKRTHLVLRQRGTDHIERVAAQHVIGADGAHSAVARAVGWPRPRLVTNLQARVALSSRDSPGVSRVWFAPQDTPYFYWLVPESAATAVVGLAHDSASEVRPKLDDFLRARGLEPIAYEAARIPLYGPAPSPTRRVGGTGVYLVGDAAGQVKGTTLGGTVTGFRGAQVAARSILRRASCWGERNHLHHELNLHWLLRSLLSRFREEDYSALLRSLNEPLHRLLHTRNRDSMAGAYWSLVASQPRLLLLAGRALTANR